RAGDGDRDRAGCAVARQADDANVVAEVLASELGADAGRLREREHLPFELEGAKAVTALAAGRRKRVEVTRRCELRRLQRVLRRGPADDDREVVRRARRRAEAAELALDEREHSLRVEERLRLLEEVALVRRSPALRH